MGDQFSQPFSSPMGCPALRVLFYRGIVRLSGTREPVPVEQSRRWDLLPPDIGDSLSMGCSPQDDLLNLVLGVGHKVCEPSRVLKPASVPSGLAPLASASPMDRGPMAW
jgi:hypothetical protein